MTDEQFETLMTGAERCHTQYELHRLGGLINAVAAVGNDPTEENIAQLLEWGVKVAYDVTRSK